MKLVLHVANRFTFLRWAQEVYRCDLLDHSHFATHLCKVLFETLVLQFPEPLSYFALI